MRHPNKYWISFTTIQIAGTTLVFFGSAMNVVLQLGGILLLLPGSLISMELPFRILWRPYLWDTFQIDSAGFANILYLPAAIVLNALIWWLVYRKRRYGNKPAPADGPHL
jgi:hypothetical protein